MAKFTVRTTVPNAKVSYGSRLHGYTRVTADRSGTATFEWAWWKGAVYVNAQKTDWVFSNRRLTAKPSTWSWGRSSDWFIVNPVTRQILLYGLSRAFAERELIKVEEAKRKLAEEKRKATEVAEKAKEFIRVVVDPALMKIIDADPRLRGLYGTDPSAAVSEARDRLAAIKAKEVVDVARDAILDKVVVRLIGWDCFKDKWKLVLGKYWACDGIQVDRVRIHMSDSPVLSCHQSAGETHRVKLLKPATFSSGHVVRFIRKGGSVKTAYVDVEITRPTKVIPKVEIPEIEIPKIEIPKIEIPKVEIPAVVTKLAKTLKVTRLVSSVFKGDTATIVGSVAVNGRPADNEPVVLYIDGRKAAETVTKHGIFSFEYKFAKAGSRKVTLESPATDRYPDAGRDVRTVLVSSVPLELEERLRAEREEYAAHREALRRKRIVIPKEYEYKPIFRREKLVTPEPEIEPEIEPGIIPAEPKPPIPTRGSIHVDLPVPPVLGQPIEVPVAVWLDDMFKGNAPITIDNVKVGSHTVVLKMTGFVSPPMDIEVREGEVTRVSGIEMIIR